MGDGRVLEGRLSLPVGEAIQKNIPAIAAEVESGLLIFTMYLIAVYAINVPAIGIYSPKTRVLVWYS